MEIVNLKFFLCVIGMVLVLEGLPYLPSRKRSSPSI